MNYIALKDSLTSIKDTYNEVGFIPNTIFKLCNITDDNIITLIKEDHTFFESTIDLIYDTTMININMGRSLDESIQDLYLFKNINNKNKEKYIRFFSIITIWLKDNSFFDDIYESNTINIIDNDDIIEYKKDNPECFSNIKQFEPRINQKEAFDRLYNKGFETGIIASATGTGKTAIILKYIDHIKTKIVNPKVILFTERVNILSDLFDFDKKKNTLIKDNSNIQKWKEIGLCDITDYEIINRVTDKKKNWAKLLLESNKPTLLVINRAFLTLKGDEYQKLEGKIDLVLHDECHNTTSVQCHKFLKYCKSYDIPIIGFSATPLRTGQNDKPLLLEIYGDPNNQNKLNLIIDYNMIYAISNKLILPPEFYWYNMKSYNKKKIHNKLVTQEELGSVLELLNHIIPSMPNKKIVAWCGTIKLAKKWKYLFEKNYKQRSNMKKFKFGLDTSESSDTTDYNEFKESTGCHILFCANKHREGSDIKLLDACIFLDKVKKRGSIPFIQSIGRVLRLCPDTPDKKVGIVIDGFVKNEHYEKNFVDKILGYYMALQNLSNDDDYNKYNTYVNLLKNVKFNTDNDMIDINIGKNTIKINCNKLQWNNIIKEFSDILQHKIKISEIEIKKLDFIKLKELIKDKKIKNKYKYKKYAKKHNLDMIPEINYKDYGWINYYDFLGVDTSNYPETSGDLLKLCKEYNITDIKMYKKNWKKYNLPEMPVELYSNFKINHINDTKDTKDTIVPDKVNDNIF
jgi:superfamily II DNA or RNA helicase